MLKTVNCVPTVFFQCGFSSLKVRCLVSRNLLLPKISFTSRKSVQTLPSIDLEFDNLNVKHKVIYNSIKNKYSFLQIKRLEKLENKKNCHEKQDDLLPYSLKFIDEEHFRETLSNKDETEDAVPESPHVNFPYKIKISQTEILESEDIKNDCGNLSPQDDKLKLEELISDPPVVTGKQWMNDYEKYTEEETDDSGVESWQLEYGTSNPSVPVSNVPCGGCGALIHCQDYSIPGYLPYEIFKACDDKDLRALTCQRCHFLQNYNTALSVAVDHKSYPALLSKIKDEKALVILMVDLTDFPCSIWPGILDIVGRARPIFLVGNKVDLLWGDSRGWLENVKESLRASFPRAANIVHVSLISAHTGFGVEELINKLHNFWQYKGDVYLVGCTNVGKSTLFNALLQSDYCKVKAVNLVQRATVAPWPGTTLNLLKFPILRPEGWRLYLRTQRLVKENKTKSAEVRLRKEQLRVQKGKIKSPPQLIGHIGCTFQAAISKEEVASEDNFCIPNRKQIRAAPPPGSGLDPNDPELKKSRWLYDTPGVFHNDQILDLLTTEELVSTLPKKTIEPRTYLFKPDWTIFIAGLARLDFVKGISPVRVTVFSSMNLPVTICRTADADSVYSSLLGTKYMAVPSGGEARLQEWPNLQQGSEFSLSGICKEKSCADVVFSSAGWISITPEPQEIVKFLPWTPQSRGIHVRHPSLLPFAVSLRGKKVEKLPVYLRTRVPQI